ncbi:unnamed protein product [Caenorhabditis angaria]|uniref:Uncharacterized protein n=1 Tax=Caenorhabditis angaria TaxID=860376 RepID=A0A9P1N9A7_9PELO|nr:unnamed protein product [Caenorhabditis angaria]
MLKNVAQVMIYHILVCSVFVAAMPTTPIPENSEQQSDPTMLIVWLVWFAFALLFAAITEWSSKRNNEDSAGKRYYYYSRHFLRDF